MLLKYAKISQQNLLKRINSQRDVIIFPHLEQARKKGNKFAVMACDQITDFKIWKDN